MIFFLSLGSCHCQVRILFRSRLVACAPVIRTFATVLSVGNSASYPIEYLLTVTGVQFPRVPGHEVVGTVVKVGTRSPLPSHMDM
jgi:hypothetical protein